MRRRVDFPQPDGPTMTTNSPSGMDTSMPCRTFCFPSYDFFTAVRVREDIRFGLSFGFSFEFGSQGFSLVLGSLGVLRLEQCNATRAQADYFSASTSPLTNHLCIPNTTASGGNMASKVAVMTKCHSVAVSPEAIMLLIPTTAVCKD